MRALLCLLIFASVTRGDDLLKLPESIKTRPGQLVKIAAVTDGKKVLWDVPETFQTESCDDGKKLICVPQVAGVFVIRCVTAIGDEPAIARCVVVVEGNAPGPAPPPEPTDELRVELQRLYDADTCREKAATLDRLTSLYRLAATEAGKPEYTTSKQLLDTIREAGRTLSRDCCVAIREKLAGDLSRIFPADAPLTQEQRTAAGLLFERYAKALEGVKR